MDTMHMFFMAILSSFIGEHVINRVIARHKSYVQINL
jgi:hypothetical protein